MGFGVQGVGVSLLIDVGLRVEGIWSRVWGLQLRV